MTDVLDREDATPAVASAVPPTDPDAGTGSGVGVEHWLLAALLGGAGAIHFAMAPSHLGESAVEGAGFVAAGWLQLALAVALVVRPARWMYGVTAASGVALIGAWAVSRTAGLPFGSHSGHAESVSIVDGVCVALEAVAVVAALSLLVGPGARLFRSRSLGLVGAVAAVVFATAAVASPSARDHASGSHGSHAAMDANGHDHGGAASGAGADDKGFSELSNGHQHERGQDEPLTPDETVALSGQLAATADLVAKYPTLGAAEAAGWSRAGPFSPGLGTHYMSPDYGLNNDGDMDAEDLARPLLIYDGLASDAPLAGYMFMAAGMDTEPEGFVGPNDHWHYHERVCITASADGGIDTPFGADLEGVTEQMCTEAGGNFIAFTGYMVHVWNVPGYESPDGMFTELNPRITCPDGTYHRIPIAELGDKDTVCLNP